jgi:2,3,4,5-tetrahydropyridine-2-carboxylate N-succinyltransferase
MAFFKSIFSFTTLLTLISVKLCKFFGRKNMSQLSTIIEQAFEDRANLSATDCPAEIRDAVEQAIAGLDNGTLRVAEKIDGEWVVHQWLKKAVLLSFKLNDNKPIESCDLRFYDKVDTKHAGWTEEQFKAAGVRVVPPAVARRGSFQAKMSC